MSAGPTSQQPPTYAAPAATHPGASVRSKDLSPLQVWVLLSHP